MTLITFPTGELGVNTYIISADGTGAAVIDPGGDAGKIRAVLSENGLKLKAVLQSQCLVGKVILNIQGHIPGAH